MVRIELYILSQIKMGKYRKGQIVKMIVPDEPIDISPCYVFQMIKNFKRNPMVEIIRVDRVRDRIWILDYVGSTWTIIPERIESDIVLFL